MNELRNMTPRQSACYPIYGFHVHAIFFGQNHSAYTFLSLLTYINNLFFCKSCLAVSLTHWGAFRMFFKSMISTTHRTVKTFYFKVVHIVSVNISPNMTRIYTSFVIASMTYLKAIWYRSLYKSVRKSVCEGFHAPQLNAAIAVGFIPSPLPTLSQVRHVTWNPAILIYFVPKPLNIFFVHNQKTPANPEVKPAQCRGNGVGGCKFLDSLLFAAASRPSTIYA